MRIVKLICLTTIALFFLGFGIELLRSAYDLKNPFEFLLSFFAANLVILISAALCVGFVVHLWRACRKTRPPKTDGAQPDRRGGSE